MLFHLHPKCLTVSIVPTRVQPTQGLHRCIFFRCVFAREPAGFCNLVRFDEEGYFPELSMLGPGTIRTEGSVQFMPAKALIK
jgi:hypothetical protein